VDRGTGRFERLGGEREFQPSERLRDEQRRAVHEVLASRDLAINLCGAAGTGKTATLQEIERGLRETGRKLMAVAPTRGAVEELHKVGFRDATTVSRLLEDETQRGAVRGKVLIVDEAGMISGRHMDELLKLAERENARVLFSGDTRQIQSVEASDALRILERESQMKSVSLTGVQRQTQEEYRDAIQTLRDSPEQGFGRLEKLGAVREDRYLDKRPEIGNSEVHSAASRCFFFCRSSISRRVHSAHLKICRSLRAASVTSPGLSIKPFKTAGSGHPLRSGLG
jgi:hypothetical protein